MEQRLRANDISLALEIPIEFGRDLKRAAGPEVSAVIDGANPFRAETIKQYALGVNSTFIDRGAATISSSARNVVRKSTIQTRYRYNPSFESVYAIVPSIPPILLILIPAILMAVSVVREKELGSIINFYVTPTTRLEFLVGKQLPYIAIGMINYVILTLMAIVVFRVPLKGSGLTLTLCALLYVTATTGIGLLVSTFTPSQVAAVFVTAVLTILPTTQFSGLLQPVSTLEGRARIVGSLWPTTYYMHASVGAFTKALGPPLLAVDVLALAAFIPVLTIVTAAALKRQES
jgi:ribosome-dependent ATPase